MTGMTRRAFVHGSVAGALLSGCAGTRGLTSAGDLARADHSLPSYTALTQQPEPTIPEALSGLAQSDSILDRAQALQKALIAPPRRPRHHQPLFTSFASAPRNFELNGLPVFTAPIDAAAYRRLKLRDVPPRYLVSDSVQFTKLLREAERIGVRTVLFNPCPYPAPLPYVGWPQSPPRVVLCGRYPESLDTKYVQTPNDAIETWSIFSAKLRAAVERCLAFALDEARAGRLEVARDVALASLGHVTLGEPRLHLVAGQAAVGLHDRTLFGEARAFLAFLRQPALTDALDRAQAAGAPDFSEQTFA